MQTLPTNRARRERRPLALAIGLPSQKSIAVVEKSRAANGGFPRAVENVARNHEEIFPRVPRTHTPVGSQDDCKKDDERERIKKHARRDCLSKKTC